MKSFSRILMAVAVFAATSTFAEEAVPVKEITAGLKKDGGTIFPMGVPNPYSQYFTGKSYLNPLSDKVNVANVTFGKGTHTYWHIHHKTCQILVPESGSGYYQIWGQPAKKFKNGETVTIPAETKHWHGAAPGHYFQHLSIMESVEGAGTEWLEEVDQKDFDSLK